MIKYFLIIKYKLKLQTKYKQKLFVLNEKQIILKINSKINLKMFISNVYFKCLFQMFITNFHFKCSFHLRHFRLNHPTYILF